MQFLTHLRLGLRSVWVLTHIVALVGVRPLEGDSLRVVWPELPFLNVWVVLASMGGGILSQPELTILA